MAQGWPDRGLNISGFGFGVTAGRYAFSGRGEHMAPNGGGYFVSEHVMSEHMLSEHMQGPVQGRPGGEHMAPNGEILWE